MRKITYILFFALLALPFAACNDDDEKSEWQIENEAAYEAAKSDPDFSEAYFPGVEKGVYYKDLNKGKEGVVYGTEYPEYTGQVSVLYKGYYYDHTDENSNCFDPGTSASDIPIDFMISSIYTSGVRGFAIALQNMRVGDKWEVCIPWWLAYGNADSGGIPAYSTLFFEIEMVAINQTPWRK